MSSKLLDIEALACLVILLFKRKGAVPVYVLPLQHFFTQYLSLPLISRQEKGSTDRMLMGPQIFNVHSPCSVWSRIFSLRIQVP